MGQELDTPLKFELQDVVVAHFGLLAVEPEPGLALGLVLGLALGLVVGPAPVLVAVRDFVLLGPVGLAVGPAAGPVVEPVGLLER